MAVVINNAVSEAWRMNEFHIFCKLTAHQRLDVLWKQAYCTCRNVSSLCLVNSKRTFTLQLVYYSTLIKYYFAVIFDKN